MILARTMSNTNRVTNVGTSSIASGRNDFDAVIASGDHDAIATMLKQVGFIRSTVSRVSNASQRKTRTAKPPR